MEFLVPAWHDQLGDWTFSTPKIEIYDGMAQAKILSDNHLPVSLLLTDYQPQMTTKLSKTAVKFHHIFSVFDYLQGIDFLSSEVLDYRDFQWPSDAIYDFGLFRLMVISQHRLFTRVIFDTQGKLLNVEYYGADGQVNRKLIIDSRGFVSAAENAKETVFYDPDGHWRFKINKKSKQVDINPDFNRFRSLTYPNIKSLINEVYISHFLKKVGIKDHLLVTLDDAATVNNQVYEPYHVLYLINPHVSFTKSVERMKSGQFVVPSKRSADRIQKVLPAAASVTVMPTFPVQVSLGHSQRMRRQIIGLFAEHFNYQELKDVVELIFKRLLKYPDDEGLQIVTYSIAQDGLVTKVMNEVKKEHADEFLTEEQAKQLAENPLAELTEDNKKPVLYLRQRRVTSIAETFALFDKLRVLINWGVSDDLIQSTAISVGIPQLQNFKAATLIDGHNGRIFQTLKQLNEDLSFYLGNLKNWNQALVYDVQLLNKYSGANLIKRWRKVLAEKSNSK